ncbi:MAG: GatB/YqeY domain-containing protein [Candidatus Shapirobacteria bacterium]|nr:GatB/YqeY domain-containing protein [Candidatus Shapirobacteria bacterium]
MMRDKLKKDSFDALKNRDNKRVDVLRFLISLIDKKELQLPPGGMTEAEEMGVLRKELKNKEESKEMFLKAGRQDLVDQLDYEIVIVKEYLPAEISEEKISEIITQAIAEKGNNFGLIMKEVMIKTGGAVDGGVISRIVKEKISNI